MNAEMVVSCTSVLLFLILDVRNYNATAVKLLYSNKPEEMKHQATSYLPSKQIRKPVQHNRRYIDDHGLIPI
jgi:hypothetical protein